MSKTTPSKRQRLTEHSLSTLMRTVGNDGQVVGVDFASSYSRISRLYKVDDKFVQEDYHTLADDGVKVTNVPSSVWLSVKDGEIVRHYDKSILRTSSSRCIKYGLKKFYGLQNLTQEVIEDARDCNIDIVVGGDGKLKIQIAEGVETDLDEEYELLCAHLFLSAISSWKDKVTRVIGFSEPVDYSPHKRKKFAAMIMRLSAMLVEKDIQKEYPRVTTAYEPSAMSVFYSFDDEKGTLKVYNTTLVSLDIGGLSTDVSEIHIAGDQIQIHAVGGIMEAGMTLTKAVSQTLATLPKEVLDKMDYKQYERVKYQIMQSEGFTQKKSMNVVIFDEVYSINLQIFNNHYRDFKYKISTLITDTLADRDPWKSFPVKDINLSEEEIREDYRVYEYSPNWQDVWKHVAPNISRFGNQVTITECATLLLNGPIFRGCSDLKKYMENDCVFADSITVVEDTAISRGLTLFALLSVNEGSYATAQQPENTVHSKLDHKWTYYGVYPNSISTIFHSYFWAKDLRSAGFKIPEPVGDDQPVLMKYIEPLCGFNTTLPASMSMSAFDLFDTERDWSLDFVEVTLSGQVRVLGEVNIKGSKRALKVQLEIQNQHTICVHVYDSTTNDLMQKIYLTLNDSVLINTTNHNPLEWGKLPHFKEYVPSSQEVTLKEHSTPHTRGKRRRTPQSKGRAKKKPKK